MVVPPLMGQSALEETDMDPEALAPASPLGNVRRLLGGAAIVAALVCAAALLPTRWAIGWPARRAAPAAGVSFALGDGLTPLGTGTLKQQAMAGQGFVFVEDASTFSVGNAVIFPGVSGEEDEVHVVRQVFPGQGTVEFHHGLLDTQPEGADVTVVDLFASPEVEAAWKKQTTSEQNKYGWALGSALPDGRGTIQLALDNGCRHIAESQEIELTSAEGLYEFNMVTLKEMGDSNCTLHLAFPTLHQHLATDNVTIMVGSDWTEDSTPAPAPPASDKFVAPSDDGGLPPWLWWVLIIGAVVLVVAIVAAVLLAMRSRSAREGDSMQPLQQ